MITLRKAVADGRLEEFIKEHEQDEEGDFDKLDAAIGYPDRGIEKEDREASKPGSGDG